MKVAYAFRRSTFYPFNADAAWVLPSGSTRTEYLRKVNDIGFDGIELGLESFGGLDADKAKVMELKKELDAAGTPCIAIRAGGALNIPKVAAHNRKRLEKSVEIASWMGVGIVNSALSSPAINKISDTGPSGEPVSHGSSQMATEEDYIRTAKVLHEVGEMAGDNGVNITIEIHQHSIADNSWSTLHLIELADSPFVHINPDLGNVLWTYEEPEESSEQCISAVAAQSKYWHCKSLQRVHIPEIEHSYYLRVPLPDGDIDYRFAINSMVEAGYDGYLALEGANTGDQLHKDQRSFNYVKGILAELEA